MQNRTMYFRRNGKLAVSYRKPKFFPITTPLDLSALRTNHYWESSEKSSVRSLALVDSGKLVVALTSGGSIEYRGLAEFLSTALTPEELMNELTLFEQLSQGHPSDAVMRLLPVMGPKSVSAQFLPALDTARRALRSWKAPEDWSEAQISLYVFSVAVISAVGVDKAEEFAYLYWNTHSSKPLAFSFRLTLARVAQSFDRQFFSQMVFSPSFSAVVEALRERYNCKSAPFSLAQMLPSYLKLLETGVEKKELERAIYASASLLAGTTATFERELVAELCIVRELGLLC